METKADDMVQQNKASDPVSQAMLAIEDALNLGLEQEAAPTENAPAEASEPVPAPPPEPPLLKAPSPKAEEPAPPPKPREEPAPRRLGPPSEPRLATPERPANDDRAAVGPIVQALQIKRPSAAPFVVAGVGSMLWFGLCAWYGWQRTPQDFTTPERIFRPESVLFLLAALAPALLLFGFAALARRLADLRQSAASIAHVSVRLAEPESMATEHVSSLAQAIRREVSNMGEGVERAFARASELEALVRNEIASLERSSGEHERRLRALVA